MGKSEAGKHGDPRLHANDIAELKTRIRQLEEENKDLTAALVAATEREREKENWRMRGW